MVQIIKRINGVVLWSIQQTTVCTNQNSSVPSFDGIQRRDSREGWPPRGAKLGIENIDRYLTACGVYHGGGRDCGPEQWGQTRTIRRASLSGT